MEFAHAKQGWRLTLKDDLRQRDVEKWSAAMRPHQPKDGRPSDAEYCGALLRGALAAGVVMHSAPALTAESVGEQPAGLVRWAGLHLAQVYAEATVIPPE